MKEEEKKHLEMDLADTITDRPQGFSVKDRHFYLYPVTLGKMFLLSRLTEKLQLRQDVASVNPYLEALRLAKEKREVCCRILTYHTTRTKAKAFDNEFIEKRTRFFSDNIDEQDLATLLLLVLQWDKTPALAVHLNIDKERKRMEKAAKAKDDSNTLTFGGQSVYGSCIDAACERYKWTYDYVLWEISYTNLRLMLADAQKQVYLSDAEMKRSGLTARQKYLSGDDPEAVRRFIEQKENWDKT